MDKLGFVGLQKHLTKPSTWEGGFGAVQTAEGFPLGGSWHGRAVTDEGAGPGQLSVRRHLIRPFGPPSPQGEGFQKFLLIAKPQLIVPFSAKRGAADGLFRPSAAHREKEMKMKKVDRVLNYQLPWPPLELPLPPKK